MLPTFRTTIIAYTLLLSGCWGHMEMSKPYPIRSNLNPAVPWSMKDYSYTSPLNADGSNFPCKGYQNDRPILTTAYYTAGGTYQMQFAGSATHGGGSCQISLSYDNGKTFRVIKSIIGGCPLPKQYDFTIPSYAPSGEALLAWTWYNHEGNREIYMNCAEVSIKGGAPQLRRSKARRADTFTSFDQLPYIWKANLPGINDCKTVEGVDPVFPNPGPDVVYGAGLSSSSPPTPGNCESPTPPGQTYKDLPVPGGSSNASITTSMLSTQSAVQTFSSTFSPQPVSKNLTIIPTTLATITNTIIFTPTSMITITASTASATASITTTIQTTTTGTSFSSPVPSTPSGSLPFAAANVLNTPLFVPCSLGTFICMSPESFAECTQAGFGANSTTHYEIIGPVAAGTRCIPSSTSSSGSSAPGFPAKSYASGGGPPGTYRNDMIV